METAVRYWRQWAVCHQCVAGVWTLAWKESAQWERVSGEGKRLWLRPGHSTLQRGQLRQVVNQGTGKAAIKKVALDVEMPMEAFRFIDCIQQTQKRTWKTLNKRISQWIYNFSGIFISQEKVFNKTFPNGNCFLHRTAREPGLHPHCWAIADLPRGLRAP